MTEKPNDNVYVIFQKKVSGFFEYVQGHWILLVLALFTGSFTYHAADYYLHNPLYTLMTIVLTEGMFLTWEYWLEGAISSGMQDNQLDTAETTQIIAAGIGVVVALVAIILTDIGSAQILGAESKAFSLFQNVPDWAQFVVVNIVWVLAVTNVMLVSVYLISSPEYALMRSKRRGQRIMKKAIIQGQIKKELEAQKTYTRLIDEAAPQLGRQQGQLEFTRQHSLPFEVKREDLNETDRPSFPPTRQ